MYTTKFWVYLQIRINLCKSNLKFSVSVLLFGMLKILIVSIKFDVVDLVPRATTKKKKVFNKRKSSHLNYIFYC